VVHGFPSDRPLAEGDILSLDLGAEYQGYYGDAALTVPVGRVSAEAERLLRVTEEALRRGLEQARPGKRLHDISWAIQSCAEEAGYGWCANMSGTASVGRCGITRCRTGRAGSGRGCRRHGSGDRADDQRRRRRSAP
jgi:methionine aminopeptidase